MKASTLIKPCLLACSVLAGAHAVAGPGTVNSIEFSFMNYSSAPSPYFSSSAGSSLGTLPSALPTPIEEMSMIPPPAPAKPVIGAYGSLPDPVSTSPFIETSQPPIRAAAAAIPEPGSLALLGLGLGLLVLRRRGGFHD